MKGIPYDELMVRFTYHAPKDFQPEKYETLRTNGLALAELINAACPVCEETQIAIHKVDEAIMWANAAIARRE